jgi:predicted O-methyltransferase YrrM
MSIRLNEYDGMASEYEMHDFLYGLVRLMKPELVVETGCYHGLMTRRLGEAVSANGHGKVISCDVEPEQVSQAISRCEGLPVEVRLSKAEDLPELHDADLIFSDSSEQSRFLEYHRAKPGCVFLMHDTDNTPSCGEFMRSKNALLFHAGRGVGLLIK